MSLLTTDRNCRAIVDLPEVAGPKRMRAPYGSLSIEHRYVMAFCCVCSGTVVRASVSSPNACSGNHLLLIGITHHLILCRPWRTQSLLSTESPSTGTPFLKNVFSFTLIMTLSTITGHRRVINHILRAVCVVAKCDCHNVHDCEPEKVPSTRLPDQIM